MTALLQAASTSGRPVTAPLQYSGRALSRVSVVQIQDDADQLTFLWTESGSPGAQR